MAVAVFSDFSHACLGARAKPAQSPFVFRRGEFRRRGAHSLLAAHSSNPRVGRRSVVRCAQVEAEPQTGEEPRIQILKNGEKFEQRKPLELIHDIWPSNAERFGDQVALLDPHTSPQVKLTYRELADEMKLFASGLRSLGLRQSEKVCLFSENSSRWLIADQGIMMNGAVDAVRGSAISLEEMHFIVENSDSIGLVVQNTKVLETAAPLFQESSKYGAQCQKFKFVVVLWGDPSEETMSTFPCPLLAYSQVIDRGRTAVEQEGFQAKICNPSDAATLVYTSGTSGLPKGVMLTHANIMYQVNSFHYFLKISKGEQMLSLLPPWHIYERSVGYHVLSKGVSFVYSSVKTLKRDLQSYPPDIFICVPLVLQSLHSKVMRQLRSASFIRKTLALTLLDASMAYIKNRRTIDGVSLEHAVNPRSSLTLTLAVLASYFLSPLHELATALVHRKIRSGLSIKGLVVSGGGSLPSNLEDFYECIGVPILNGWGLTETSPVLACRRQILNVRGSVGLPTPGTDLKIVDPEGFPDRLVEMEDGESGLILAKGPGVMGGYQKDEAETAKAFAAGHGWFNTGDLGKRCPAGVPGSHMAGNIVLTGRLKDVIVLSNGENVEPQPIEDLLGSSPLIKNVMLVGQDQRKLGALVVVDEEALEESMIGDDSAILSAVRDDISKLEKKSPGYIPQLRIAAIHICKEPFSVESGTLTQTMKVRRQQVMEFYKEEIFKLMTKLG
ncbi:hypothetical protein BSKO_00417 [Bryopsis sp. KO-2023]|nr:hypothetical protein BSKO_00417 [Bryopsis sp. KO-2023]